jgi:hypothetical protein
MDLLLSRVGSNNLISCYLSRSCSNHVGLLSPPSPKYPTPRYLLVIAVRAVEKAK